jgi:hypothetical protein
MKSGLVLGENDTLALQTGLAEVHQQTKLQPGGLEIVDQLSLVYWVFLLNGLELNNDLPVNHHVGTEIADDVSVVGNLERNLSPYGETTLCQLNPQCIFVQVFEETTPKLIMYIDASALDAIHFIGEK